MSRHHVSPSHQSADRARATLFGPEVLPCLEFHGGRRRVHGLIECEIVRAIDRPDGFRMEILDSRPYFVDAVHGVEIEDDLPAPGTPIAMALGNTRPVEGRVEELGVHEEDDGVRISLHATVLDEARRQRVGPRDCRDLTVAEIARRLALDLGLRAQVDANESLVPVFELREDPLRALRTLSRAHSMGLALVADCLYLVHDLPAAGCVHDLGVVHPRGLVRFRMRHLLGANAMPHRLIEVSLPGPVTASLLDQIRVRGYHARCDGDYRLVRSHVRLTTEGWCSDLLLSEEAAASVSLDLPMGVGGDR